MILLLIGFAAALFFFVCLVAYSLCRVAAISDQIIEQMEIPDEYDKSEIE